MDIDTLSCKSETSKDSKALEDPPIFIVPWKRPQFKGCKVYFPFDIYADHEALGYGIQIQKEPPLKLDPNNYKYRFAVPEMVSLPDQKLILNSMKCSFCSKIPMPDALMCLDGHFVCANKCYKSIGSCPFEIVRKTEFGAASVLKRSCGMRITTARHQLFTHLYENSISTCPHYGCGARVLSKELYMHQINCKYTSKIKCQNKNECGISSLDFVMYPIHLVKYHDVEFITASRQCFLWTFDPEEGLLGCVVKKLFYHCDTTFGLVVQIYDNILNIWLSDFSELRVGSKEMFCGHIQLSGRKSRSQNYVGPIYSYRDRVDVVRQNECLSIPISSIPLFSRRRTGNTSFVLDIFINAPCRSDAPTKWKSCNKKMVENPLGTKDLKLATAMKEFIEKFREQHSSSKEEDLCDKGFLQFQQQFEQ